MADFVITCPNPTCRKPLNLPAAAVGRSLSCPHCKTPIRVTLGADGTPTEPVAIPTSKRVPGMFLLPGFALLILGGAAMFINGYIAYDAAAHPDVASKYSRLVVDALRANDSLTSAAKESKGKSGDPTPQELFAAVAGQVARVAEQERADEALVVGWAPHVARIHTIFLVVSFVSAAGGVALLRGQWYWLAVVGCVAGIVNLNIGCCIPMGIAGLWGLLVLARDDGRRFFGRLA